MNEKGTVLTPVFTFENNAVGFAILLKNIRTFCRDFSQAKIGLESTGHYGNNLLSFLKAQGFVITVFNPLQVDLYRKAGTLRKTKTDKADAKFIAQMLLTAENSTRADISPLIVELKALVRHRSRIKAMRTKLRVSVTRLVSVLFPELPTVVGKVHQASTYALLLELPCAKDIADCHLTRLSNLLAESSKKRLGKERALEIKSLASKSIGLNSRAVGFELQQNIRLIRSVCSEVDVLEKEIKALMLKINSPILTIPGISYNLGSVILSEIGNIENFANPSKLLAFAGLEPSTHQSGNYYGSNASMVKRGSPHLRWAILQAARLIAQNDPTFKAYAQKKESEGKHFFVVLNHTGKKLLRVMFHMLKNNQEFVAAA